MSRSPAPQPAGPRDDKVSASAGSTLRLTSVVDVAAAVPHLLGFVPSTSIVVIGLDAGGHVVVTGRGDLADCGDPETAGYFARMCTGAGVRRAVVIAVVDPPGQVTPDALPAMAETHTVAGVLIGAGVDLAPALCVVGGRLWMYDGVPGAAGPVDWPVEGVPVPAYQESPLAAAGVLDGEVVWADRAALVASIAPAPSRVLSDTRAQVHRMVDDMLARLADGPSADSYRAQTLDLWADARQQSVEGRLPDVAHSARLLVGIADVLTRDLIIAEGRGRVARETLPLAAHLVRCAVSPYVATAGALLAWFAYLDGQGTLAGVALERVHHEDPDHRLAAMVEQALTWALPPSVLRDVAAGTAVDLAEMVDPAGPLRGWRERLRR